VTGPASVNPGQLQVLKTDARTGLPRATPSVAQALAKAQAALAHCCDLVSLSACRPALTYLRGAEGNVRNAMAQLLHRHPHLADGVDFDTTRVGNAEVIGCASFPDTVLNCRMPDGSLGAARAIVPARNVESAAWMRPLPEQPGVWMRGRVVFEANILAFVDDREMELPIATRRGPDLGRDLVGSGLDLSTRPVLAVAMELTLTSGSWVHLPSGRRWFADRQTARAVVRMLGGSPALDEAQAERMGGCVDAGALSLIEGLGWRYWPTPGLS
jgi:hypothetical protein